MKAPQATLGAFIALTIVGCGDEPSVSPERDDVPPSAVTDLSFLRLGEDRVKLMWRSPGDDGMEGRASSYDVRYSTDRLQESNWASATRLDSLTTPAEPGTPESLEVSLDPEASVYFALKTADEVPNWSALSNSIWVVLGDTVAPAPVSDLAVSRTAATEVTLTWTAPGDDGSEGTAAEYDLRHLPSMITDSTWSQATSITGLAPPSEAGVQEQVTASLVAGSVYYFAVRTRDESGNWSDISNSPLADLSIDSTPPGAVTDLSSEFVTGHSATITWTAPGDDVHDGTAARYDVRYALTPLTEETWNSATPAELISSPAPAGNLERMVVENLGLEQEYFFGLRAIDESKNTSELSNIATATTVRVLDLTLTRGSSFAIDPDWAPDGKTIVFGRFGPGPGDIYVIPATGGDARQIASDPAHDRAPQWSADGRRIGVISNRGGKDEIWSFDLEDPTADPILLASHETSIISWSWAPDGLAIAYSALTSSNPTTMGIFTTSRPGEAPIQLVAHASSPAWSPDGSKIAFSSTRSVTTDIWIMSANGGDQRAVTDDLGHDGQATWSPDGQKIAFLSDRSGTLGFWSISIDGGLIEKIETGPPGSSLSQPDWSPDGSAIAYISNGGGGQSVWVTYLF